jgi:hypothetical protein
MLRKALLSVSPFILSFLMVGCGEKQKLAACADGVDSDGDVFIDDADPGCTSIDDDDETDPQCLDGIDNDFDGLVDAADPQCTPGSNAEANIAALPDLRLDPNINDVAPQQFKINRQNDGQTFDAELADGCLKGDSERDVILFDGIIENIGNADLIVGSTDDHLDTYTFNQNLDQLEFAGWLDYKLFDAQGTQVGDGHKGSFCMLDLNNADGFGDNNFQFDDCTANQGITIHMADIYNRALPCQYVDVTGLPAGDYSLRVEVNSTKQLPESNYNNNIIEYPVTIQ